MYLESATGFHASPIIPPLANLFICINYDRMFGWPDVPHDAAMAGKRDDQDPVTRN
jgi:hypothetical protein